MHNDCDVVIIGSGVAGLLIAKELADLRVAVIDAKQDGNYRTFCLTKAVMPSLRGDLAADVACHAQLVADANGDQYLIWNRDLLLTALRYRVSQIGHAFELAAQFFDFSYVQNRAVLRTAHAIYSARVIVDCMGSRSPLLFRLGIAEIVKLSLVYSRIVRRRTVTPHVARVNSRLIENLPAGEEFTEVVMITDAQDLRRHSSLHDDLRIGLRGEEESLTGIRGGIVPTIRFRPRPNERVVAIDAADDDTSFGNVDGMTRALETSGTAAPLIRRYLSALA